MRSIPTHFKESYWWRESSEGILICTLCPRECRFERDKTVGACGVRVRLNNKIYLAIYGKTSGWAMDPIEKKPLFHFYPGSCAFSIGTIGCNMFCLHCQNWFISQARISPHTLKYPMQLESLSPEDAVNLAKENNCTSIAYTYNEPIVWYEYMLDTAKLAKKHGLKNVIVSNGYINEEPLLELVKFIDAGNIDLKGDSIFYQRLTGTFKAPETILRTIEILKEHNVHVEITVLVIPSWNDKEEFIKWVARWIMENFGAEEVPLHITRFYPNYMLRSIPPTPIKTLEKARETAIREGLKYVYTGNVPGHKGEHTYCPQCGKPVIKREGFYITEWNLNDKNRCRFCGYRINIRGRLKRERKWFYFY